MARPGGPRVQQWRHKIITASTYPQIGKCIVTSTNNLEFDGV